MKSKLKFGNDGLTERERSRYARRWRRGQIFTAKELHHTRAVELTRTQMTW